MGFECLIWQVLPLGFPFKQGVDQVNLDQMFVYQCNDSSIPRLVVGGGSNLVHLEPEFVGIVLGLILEIKESGNDVYLEVGAGHPWHQLVMKTLDAGWFGLEIWLLSRGGWEPPLFKCGAYGVELKDHCHRGQAL